MKRELPMDFGAGSSLAHPSHHWEGELAMMAMLLAIHPSASDDLKH
jgi:hypothetical protein